MKTVTFDYKKYVNDQINSRKIVEVTYDELKEKINERIKAFHLTYFSSKYGNSAINESLINILNYTARKLNVNELLNPSKDNLIVWKYGDYYIKLEPWSLYELEIHTLNSERDKMTIWNWSSCYYNQVDMTFTVWKPKSEVVEDNYDDDLSNEALLKKIKKEKDAKTINTFEDWWNEVTKVDETKN